MTVKLLENIKKISGLEKDEMNNNGLCSQYSKLRQSVTGLTLVKSKAWVP